MRLRDFKPKNTLTVDVIRRAVETLRNKPARISEYRTYYSKDLITTLPKDDGPWTITVHETDTFSPSVDFPRYGSRNIVVYIPREPQVEKPRQVRMASLLHELGHVAAFILGSAYNNLDPRSVGRSPSEEVDAQGIIDAEMEAWDFAFMMFDRDRSIQSYVEGYRRHDKPKGLLTWRP
ncbi:MAG TPA: hypothetical protein VKT80_18290 [Chloroflexota bacterium]|nr:hypothetical protein [Chloroflexota bacterium]